MKFGLLGSLGLRALCDCSTAQSIDDRWQLQGYLEILSPS